MDTPHDDTKPPRRNFMNLLRAQWRKGNFVCVGLDTESARIPNIGEHRDRLTVPNAFSYGLVDATGAVVGDCTVNISLHLPHGIGEAIYTYNQFLIDQTGDAAAAIKLNLAFYLEHGADGIEALRRTIDYAHRRHNNIPVILDGKFGDIGNTNCSYIEFLMSFGADAVTLNPYVGRVALKPFLDDPNLGAIMLCRTSNEGADEFQNLLLIDGTPLYQRVAYNIARDWNTNGNCVLVVGATCPDELRAVRVPAPDIPLLIPGVGAQGGTVEDVVPYAMDSNGDGFIINSSRNIIFAKDPRAATIKLNDSINLIRQKTRKGD